MQHATVKLENIKSSTKTKQLVFADDEFNPELFLENTHLEKNHNQIFWDKNDPLLSLTQAWWTD